MSITPKCSFRICGLTEDNLLELVAKHLHEIDYRKGIFHKDKTKKVLRIIISDAVTIELLSSILMDVTGDVDHDFFVSVSSDEQTVIVDIPERVLDLHNTLGGKICFSYTCTFDPSD